MELKIKKVFRIMYLFPQVIGCSQRIQRINTIFLRISNYLNSKKEELCGEIEEIYIDLRLEELPPFSFQDIRTYLEGAKSLFKNLYEEFPFDLIAISCYTSFEYLNSIIVAYLIKNFIKPDIKIVVGGYHPTISPEEFQFDNIPSFIKEYFPKLESLFDYLIRGEGEITFFELIKQLLSSKLKNGIEGNKDCIILEGQTFPYLDEMPLIDLKLLKPYKDELKGKRLTVDFGRGCMFQCTVCISATGTTIPFHKKVRFKSVDRCMEELRIIKQSTWLEVGGIAISDPIFFPKRSLRTEFYEKFKVFKKNEGFSYSIHVYDRVDLCSKEDLLHYKEFNMLPLFGFESASVSMLKILNKVNSKNEIDFINYIKKYEEHIIFSNEIDLMMGVDLILGLPGETESVINENRDFLLEKRFNGKSLSEMYNIILDIRYYRAQPGALLYYTCEKKFGGRIHYKKWWRMPLEDHWAFSKIVSPSRSLTFLDSLRLNYTWIKKFVRHQIKNNTPYFEKGDIKILREACFKFTHIYKNGREDYDSFIPEFWKQNFVYP